MYTQSRTDRESDEFEKWFAREFEAPGLAASARLIEERNLTKDEWYAVIRLVALQHLRTPWGYLETMKRWEETVPEILDTTMSDLKGYLEQTAEGRSANQNTARSANSFEGIFNVRVERDDSNENASIVHAEFPLNRRSWLASMQHILTGVAARLFDHQWRVLTPSDGQEWPLTDHPSLRINFWSLDNVDYGGGWGRRGCDLMMPVSPKHLVYAEVGKKGRRRLQLAHHQTRVIQKVLVGGAHRWIFAAQPYEWVKTERPRVVDPEKYATEKDMWDRWHQDQVQSEIQSAP